MLLKRKPKSRKERLQKKRIRVKKKVLNMRNPRPRLCVFRSNKHIFAQIFDDEKRITLVACSSLDPEVRKELPNSGGGGNCKAAELVGLRLAKLAKEKQGIEKVVFDRNGYLFHGRVKALADSARKGGLIF